MCVQASRQNALLDQRIGIEERRRWRSPCALRADYGARTRQDPIELGNWRTRLSAFAPKRLPQPHPQRPLRL